MQGRAGVLNNFTAVLIDQSGQRYSGGAGQLAVAMSRFPPTTGDSTTILQSVTDGGDGGVVVSWNGTLGTPADNSILYQLNISVAATGEVNTGSNM